MSHAPAVHRAALQRFKAEPGVCKKYPEAEIYGGQIGEEFPFFLLARRDSLAVAKR